MQEILQIGAIAPPRGLLAAFASCNFRMNEFTGAVLRGQVQKLETICAALRKNARQVREAIADLPDLKLRKTADQDGDLGVGVFLDLGTRERRDKFLKAVAAEGISLSRYIPNGLHREPWTDHILTLKEYKTMYSSGRLKKFREELNLPGCDHVCANMVMLWASGPLLSPQSELDDVINAIMKVYENRDKLSLI